MDETTRELAKYAQGRDSKVSDHGSFGWLDGLPVNKSHGEISHNGNQIQVIDGMVFKNGSYQGRAD
jgi:hypothetical protein